MSYKNKLCARVNSSTKVAFFASGTAKDNVVFEYRLKSFRTRDGGSVWTLLENKYDNNEKIWISDRGWTKGSLSYNHRLTINSIVVDTTDEEEALSRNRIYCHK